MTPSQSLLFDVILETVSGFIAFYVAYRAYRAYKHTTEPALLTFSLSFSILGASSLTRNSLILTSVLGAAKVIPVRPYSLLGDALLASASALAYSLLLWRQASTILGQGEEPSDITAQLLFTAITLSFNLLNVLILLSMILIVLYRYSKDRETSQLLVAGSFVFLTASHLSNLLSSAAPQLLVVETSFRLIGYFLLLFMLGRVGRK